MFKLIRRVTVICKELPGANSKCHKPVSTAQRCVCTVDSPPGVQVKKDVSSIPTTIVGQPTCHTHPHLVLPGQLVYGITQAEFKERRSKLISCLQSESPNTNRSHIVVIPGACKQYMSDKIPFVFRQNSDFFYLTGCMEPGAVLVLVKPNLSDNYKSILFVSEKDSHAELWEGPRTGCTLATQLFTVDEARPVHTFEQEIDNIVSKSKPSALWYSTSPPANPEIHKTMKKVIKRESTSTTVSDPQKTLHSMRLIKSPAEIQIMHEACQIGAQSMNLAMACSKPGISEHTVNAILDYSCRTSGAEHLAFPPVVAGGPRACHIHYVANNQILTREDMLLVDSGCQRWLYNCDISRTWPISGQFSSHHRILYELVLAVQKRLLELLHEYRPPLDHLFDAMCRLLGKHLQEEGLIRKDVEGNELITKAYNLCPHHVSHYLGLDVHDTSLIKRNIPVRAGMVVTVEPGIYISERELSVPREFRGVGVRVEDDVLVTEGAPVVLTRDAVKEVSDIEALVGKQTM